VNSCDCIAAPVLDAGHGCVNIVEHDIPEPRTVNVRALDSWVSAILTVVFWVSSLVVLSESAQGVNTVD
jgi:hypothetical protein